MIGDVNGATFSSPDGTEFVLRPAQMASCGVTGMGYREGRERIVGLIDEATDRYGIGDTWVEDITLVAVWDIGDSDAARELLVENVLRLDEDGKYYLVTPVEKIGIIVDDAPFVAVDFRIEGGAEPLIIFVTNVGDETVAGPENPIRVVRDPATGQPSP